MNEKEESLWSELNEIESFIARRSLIFNDINSGNKLFELIAKNEPGRLLKLLGGDEGDSIRYNWASEYTYEDYLEEEDQEYDEKEATEWDVDEKSIERAHDSGHWYVTGELVLEGLKGEELAFEFQYTEGYFDGIIGTPYNTDEDGKDHGIYFD